jgi:hypothetical protein
MGNHECHTCDRPITSCECPATPQKLKYFLHVYNSYSLADCAMTEMWAYMQHYPEALLKKEAHVIHTKALTHIFVNPQDIEHKLRGVEFVGVHINYYAKITPMQVEIIKSRIGRT